jgi:hypothetical protein
MGLTDLMDSGANTPVRRRRRWLGCLPLLLLSLVAAVVVGMYLGHRNLLTIPLVEGCTASTPDGIVSLDVDQMDSASTISAVTVSRGLPERAATIALATAMQESKLVNLDSGDLDSVGLFQQRPSEGWGTVAQISDPVYATDSFLDRLVQIPGYVNLPLTVAAQDVQHSGYPDAYAQHETDATVLSGALTGRVPAAVSCQVNSVGTAPAGSGAQLLEGRLVKEFGAIVHPKPVAAAPVSSSASPGAVAPGPQVSVSAQSGVTGSVQRDWAVAQWAVAHCQDLHISAVQYAGRVWTAAASVKGWQPAPAGTASGSSSGPVLISVAVH